MIYLDNGATTFPKPKSVTNAVNKALTEFGANAGRGGHKLAIRASEEIYKCRKTIGEYYHISDIEKIIFTNNCTTALNTVIKGVLRPNDHVVISCLEHNAVVRPLEKLKKIGVTYTKAQIEPFDHNKTIDSFRKAITDRTKLVICTHASNVFGFKLPVERITALCHQYGIMVCVDVAQSAGLIPINLEESKVDFLCSAGHKGLYGPMGTGFLIINTDNIPDSLTEGGTGSNSLMTTQPEILPDKFESGTPNLPGIVGLRAGIEYVMNKSKHIYQNEMNIIKYLYNSLKENKNIILYHQLPKENYAVPVLSFNVKEHDSEYVSAYLNDKFNIATRSGLHCCPLAHEFMGTDNIGTVRVVPSVFTTKAQIDTLIYGLRKIK